MWMTFGNEVYLLWVRVIGEANLNVYYFLALDQFYDYVQCIGSRQLEYYLWGLMKKAIKMDMLMKLR